MQIASEPAVVAAARKHAVDVCRDTLDDARCDDLALAVSELVTNAIRHGGDPVTLTVLPSDGIVRVEVTDGTQGPVRPADASELSTGQRGLRLVSAVCRDWGWEPVPGGGKRVWCVI